MINIPLNDALSEEIRRCMRLKKIPQQRLAQMLGLPSGIVSKIVKGELIPTREQIEEIIDCLSPTEESIERLRALAVRLNAGLVAGTQGENTDLRCKRERRGLTIPMLSNRTGIKTLRLAELENLNAPSPTPAEQMVLDRVLKVADAPMDSCTPISTPLKTFSQNLHPLLYLQDFAFFDHKKPLEELVLLRSREKTLWEISSQKPAVIILADCRQLQTVFPGFAFLAVSDPSKTSQHHWELWCDKKGNYSLRELYEGKWYPAHCTLPEATIMPKRWCLPLLDFVFKPFDLTIGENPR